MITLTTEELKEIAKHFTNYSIDEKAKGSISAMQFSSTKRVIQYIKNPNNSITIIKILR